MRKRECHFCQRPLPEDMDQVIDEGWIPDFWTEPYGSPTAQHIDQPVCPECVNKNLELDQNLEFFKTEGVNGVA